VGWVVISWLTRDGLGRVVILLLAGLLCLVVLRLLMIVHCAS
jgi:hypothetical protein